MYVFYERESQYDLGEDIVSYSICHEELEDESEVDHNYWVNAISQPVESPEEEDIEGLL